MVPNNKATMITWIKQELGEPVIRINVADSQIENSIDKALDYWKEFSESGQERSYLRVQITQDDLTNNYVPLPANVQAVLGCYGPVTMAGSSSPDSLFNFNYQLMASTVWDLVAFGNLSGFFIAKQYLSEIDFMLNQAPMVMYRVTTGRLVFAPELAKRMNVGDYLIVEVQAYLDETTFTKVWGNRLLRNLALAYTKKIWGNNIKKFSGVTLPSGITLNGSEIYNDALVDIEAAEEEIQANQEPLGIIIG